MKPAATQVGEKTNLEEVACCPVCGSISYTHFLTGKDYTVSREEFNIVACNQCTFKFTNPRPSEAQAGNYYQSTAYISHSDSKQGITEMAYQFIRKVAIRQKVQLVNQLSKQGLLLDIGCGTGSFMAACKMNGWTVKGIEPDEKARGKAINQTQAEIKDNFLKAYDELQFDVITMWHVLEHVHLLNETINKIKRNLHESGYLVIAVPNSDSFDAAFYKNYWAAYDLPRHLHHFSPDTLQELLHRHGFRLQKKVPMKFDAYYISLLSNRYRKGSNAYLSAMYDGWRSNRWAANHNNNYSSLTYVFSK